MPPPDPALHDPVPGQLALPGLPPVDGQLVLPGFAGVAAPPARSSHRGTPLAAPPSAATIARFRSKVVITPGCHFFVGAVSNPDGYGRNRAELHRFMHSTVRRYLATVHVK